MKVVVLKSIFFSQRILGILVGGRGVRWNVNVYDVNYKDFYLSLVIFIEFGGFQVSYGKGSYVDLRMWFNLLYVCIYNVENF